MKKNKWTFIVRAIKSATIALSTVLTINNMPYATITVLVIGAIANEAIEYFDLKK